MIRTRLVLAIVLLLLSELSLSCRQSDAPRAAALKRQTHRTTALTYDSFAWSGVWSVAVDPVTLGTLYAGTQDGLVPKSTDGGATWTPSVSAGRPVLTLAIDPSNPATVYAGAGEPMPEWPSFATGGLLKSTDSGLTWNDTGLNPTTFSLVR
jgi:hypothetical protein